MSESHKRLIEDYLPIQAISAEASREKSVRKGHISTLHLWWARRPLVACRAAVYGVLVPASRFVPENGRENKKQSLGRANAARFVERLCKYPGNPSVIADAQKHILEAHAERLTAEVEAARSGGSKPAWIGEFKFEGERVTADDILAGRAPRPRVMDMFAGGGAIPLEALRLGCEAYALDLNPVAYIIELCTLVFPQKYGKPDPTAGGMTGPKNEKGESTWGGLAEEVRYWGNWVLQMVKAEIGDLYPPIPDPEFKGWRKEIQTDWLKENSTDSIPPGYLTPVAYLWTRTVRCKNPACGAIVPLVRQTWLCKKQSRYVAMKMVASKEQKRVRFEVVEAHSEKQLGFDPEGFSKGGNTSCPFCGTVADNDYVKSEGCAGRIAQQLMALVCTRPRQRGKVYVSADEVPNSTPDDPDIQRRIEGLCQRTGLTVPTEPLPPQGTLGFRIQPYGFRAWRDLYLPRQLLCILTFASAIREANERINKLARDQEQAPAIATYLGLAADRVAMFGNSFCAWYYQEQAVSGTFSRQALPMLWDFGEISLNADISGGIEGGITRIVDTISLSQQVQHLGKVLRGAAQAASSYFSGCDVVLTDPPYYDNIPYADLSDFFYVWLKRTIGHLYPEHFASETTPKKSEAIAEPARHGGNHDAARLAYESMMAAAFREAWKALKPSGLLVAVYAHKTTLGWATLVEALKSAGFTVVEAWPVETEGPGRLRAHESAALASSMLLVARKREGTDKGSFDEQVRPGLEEIVRERVETLWDMGISGADLVIACVGAGLRAFTRFARVEYANGEEVPAERFLAEVETVVLETILGRLSKEVGGTGQASLAGLDAPTRFYTLWRYTYRTAELDAGETIVFANGTHVELDGPGGLSSSPRALVEKKKGTYRLRDFGERGQDEKLGLPGGDGLPAPIIDALQRTLWLMENRPAELAEFLREAQPNREQMRLVAQALAGPALKGGELPDVSPTGELAALTKLMANWKSVVEDAALSAQEKEDQRTGQQRML